MADPEIVPPAVDTASARLSASYNPLSESEIVDFYYEIDKEKKGFVTFGQLTERLEDVVNDLSPPSNPIHRLPEIRSRRNDDLEANSNKIDNAQIQTLLHELFPESDSTVTKTDFIAHVRSWNVLSPAQAVPSEARPPLTERLRARWEVDGPRIAFLTLIIGLQVGFGLWQMIKYIKAPVVRSAFGWGVILSKAAAGAIYPTMFFLLLSMSRYFATLIRRFKYVPRILNWDRSQATHVWMAMVGLVLATLHAIGYFAGSFVHGSQPANHAAVQKVFDPSTAPTSYVGFIRELPGWTGMTALGLYWTIAILSAPMIRRWSYEAFQLGHILMFPFLGLVLAHGAQKILQRPMLGYWLTFPLFLTLLERSTRLAHGCRSVRARLEILDELTVSIKFEHPRGNWWNYEAGQYIFLQVPSISFWQWHPFTVSSCNGKLVQVHIQTGGDWTRRLRALPTDEDIKIGVDGPFGATSQRFYEFDRAVVIGAGVGITPFSAIMTDLEQKLVNGIDPWAHVRHADDLSKVEKSIALDHLPAPLTTPKVTPRGSVSGERETVKPRTKRRVDFHWIVREREDLLWFSTLLNRAYDLSLNLPSSSVDLNINTYITTRRKDLSTHVFSYLLDSHRSSSVPYSTLTGLKSRSRLGRPDVGAILLELHNDLKEKGWIGGRVGVFFCGRANVGQMLAEACTKLTTISRRDGSKIRYIFMMEVFG